MRRLAQLTSNVCIAPASALQVLGAVPQAPFSFCHRLQACHPGSEQTQRACTTSASHSPQASWLQQQGPLQHRCMSTQADPTDMLSGFRRYMEPDVHDPHEQQLAKHFSSAKEAVGHYHRPRDWSVGTLDSLGDRMESFWNRFDAYSACFRSIRRFTRGRFLEDACHVFRSVSHALASQQLTEVDMVKELLVPALYQHLRAEAKINQAFQNKARVMWELVELTSAEVVDGAIEQVIPEQISKMRPSKLNVAQFTVRFVSKQRMWLEDKSGMVVSGSKEQIHQCEDYWVFERPFYLSWFVRKPGPRGARWRLVEQLKTEAVFNPSEDVRKDAISAGQERTLKTVAWVAFPCALGYGVYYMMMM